MINIFLFLLQAHSYFFYQPQIEINFGNQNYETNNSLDENKLTENIRKQILPILIQNGFSNFESQPYGNQGQGAITMDENGNLIVKPLDDRDDLDKLIQNKFWYKDIIGNEKFLQILKKNNSVAFSSEEIKNLKNVYLFKNAQDLGSLGYNIVSWRTRKNHDELSRRRNISTAFKNFGNVRVINPGDEFSYMQNIDFDSDVEKNYKNGLAIVNGKEIMVYGGGLCGGSTAIYQGALLNAGLQINTRNHSKWYSSLYPAYINDTLVTTPGLDATIYEGTTDLKIKNITTHPIVVVANYDGKIGSTEENFTLGYSSDKGNYNFVKKYSTKSGYTCYVWNINNDQKTSCYKEVH